MYKVDPNTHQPIRTNTQTRKPQTNGTFGIEAATPLGLCRCADRSQGSSFLATLGFETESRRDSLSEMSKLQSAGWKPALRRTGRTLSMALSAATGDPVALRHTKDGEFPSPCSAVRIAGLTA